MMEPTASLVRLSLGQLTDIRRRTGDFSDRVVAEACAVGLSYWASGSSPAGLDLTAGTLFTDVLAWVDNGGTAPGGWGVGADGRSITLPDGAVPDGAQLALDDLADFPDRPLGTIGPSAPAQRLENLARWNDTDADRVRPTLVAMFREQARARPDAVAVVDDRRTLTYRQADELSAQLAHHLIARGVTAEDVVGISLERSADMVIALLGVLRAGGAFVPLDPHWPAERRAVVVQDARVVVQLNPSGEHAPNEPEAVAVDLGDWRFGDHPTEGPEVPSPATPWRT